MLLALTTAAMRALEFIIQAGFARVAGVKQTGITIRGHQRVVHFLFSEVRLSYRRPGIVFCASDQANAGEKENSA